MNYLDLFSGIGGFALGAHMAGLRFDTHYFSEVDPWAVKLYQKRFPDAIPLGDIRGIDGKALADAESNKQRRARTAPRRQQSATGGRDPQPSTDWIITGGFPCQDISYAGAGAGLSGERSGLWYEFHRVIGELQPRYVIVENVAALFTRGIDRVLGSLAEIGYDAEWETIRASDVGAPHRRERVWIVAYPSGLRCDTVGAEQPLQGTGPYSETRGNIPDTLRPECEPRTGRRGIREGDTTDDVADARREHVIRRSGERSNEESARSLSWASRCGTNDERQWTTEPDVGRLAHGISHRVDRLRGLGNAIVPQIAELIFRQIAPLLPPASPD